MVDNVSNVNGLSGGASRQIKKTYQFNDTAPNADAVELSSDVMRLKGVEGIRLDKVMEVKRAIANGTFMTAEKLDKSLDRAIDEALR
jgi:anti-sigma28 factor (negative regulator of flagellin synthesis)